jgi:hypothetical protein
MQSAVAGEDVQLGHRIEAHSAVADVRIVPLLILIRAAPHLLDDVLILCDFQERPVRGVGMDAIDVTI